MTERDRTDLGGLTGATGDLTFEENDRPLVTGEAREASDPEHRADVTAGQVHGAPAQRGETGESAEHPARPDAEARIGGDEKADQEEHL